MGQLRRTRLSGNPELQALLKLMASFGQMAVKYSVVLSQSGWLFERAAVRLGEPSENIRQQIHRVQERVRALLGDAWWMPVRKRGPVRYGADDTHYRFRGDPSNSAFLLGEHEEHSREHED